MIATTTSNSLKEKPRRERRDPSTRAAELPMIEMFKRPPSVRSSCGVLAQATREETGCAKPKVIVGIQP